MNWLIQFVEISLNWLIQFVKISFRPEILSKIFTESRHWQSFELWMFNTTVCYVKVFWDLGKEGVGVRRNIQQAGKLNIFHPFWLFENVGLLNVVTHEKRKVGICFTIFIQYFVSSGVSGASALTVALQLQNYLGKHCL